MASHARPNRARLGHIFENRERNRGDGGDRDAVVTFTEPTRWPLDERRHQRIGALDLGLQAVALALGHGHEDGVGAAQPHLRLPCPSTPAPAGPTGLPASTNRTSSKAV